MAESQSVPQKVGQQLFAGRAGDIRTVCFRPLRLHQVRGDDANVEAGPFVQRSDELCIAVCEIVIDRYDMTGKTAPPGEHGADAGDQTRILTPLEAQQQGVDYMVIGRPITRAAEPTQAVADILRELGIA